MVIRLAVLDMAGTTVRDGGVVERSFVEALSGMGFDPDGAELRAAPRLRARDDGPVEDHGLPFRVRRRRGLGRRRPTSGSSPRSTRAVSRGDIEPLPGAETALERVARPRRADLPDDRVLVRHPGAVDGRARLARSRRPLAQPRRRRPRAALSRPDPDRAHAARHRRGAGGRGRRRHDERPRGRHRRRRVGRGRACSPVRTTAPSSSPPRRTPTSSTRSPISPPSSSRLTRSRRVRPSLAALQRAENERSRVGSQVSRAGTTQSGTLASSSARRSSSSASRSGAARERGDLGVVHQPALHLERDDAARR